MAKKKRVNKRDSKNGMIVITIAAVVLFAVLFIQGVSLRKTVNANEAVTEQLLEKIEEEEQRTEDIEGMRDYIRSEENIKNTARDKLGLVEDDDIIFKPENGD